MKSYNLQIKHATVDHIPFIQSLSRTYSDELGFVRRVSLMESLQRHTLYVAEYDNSFAGFISWYPRLNGWNTIREIAVHPDFTHKGVGRMLLYSVPAPFQLKCTYDNPANVFYASCGMRLREIESGRKRLLHVWQRKLLYIMCKGGQKRVKDIPYNAGMAYGVRHTETPYYQPFFLDIKWKDYDWNDYCHKVSLWKPVFALVPDYESKSQRKDLYSKMRDLKSLGVMRVGCCPKFDGAIKDIPSWVIICVSVPSTYAGFLPDKNEVENRRLHLLGGSPKKQLEVLHKYENAITISADGNMFTKSAWYGTWYSAEENKWKYKKGDKTYDEAVMLSALNVVKVFES